MDYIKECETLIDQAWHIFKEIPLGEKYLERLSSLKVRLHQPCVLAIAGKVKAGKSSFLNALIGENLAKVGDLETTATINKFSFGTPEDANRPVKVVWDDGSESYETLEFMNSLQGHDETTLKKASKISFLQYFVNNPLLRELTLVDTPGTGAVVSEHQEIAERFFNLREKHKSQTLKCTSEADAVVYLMGAVANVRDKSFLDDFKTNTEGGIPLNAIGVLSKVDIDTQLLDNRLEQAAYLANSLREQLSTVIPVSAGIFNIVQQYQPYFHQWERIFKSIPEDTFYKMMKSEKLFLLPQYSSIPIEQRKEIKSDIPWSIFRTIAITLVESADVASATKKLYEISNIKEVKRIINDFFFCRSKTIRCSRVLSELYSLCLKVQTLGIYGLRTENDKFKRWEKFLNDQSHSVVANELLQYLKSNHKDDNEINSLESKLSLSLKTTIEKLQGIISDADLDFQMLQLLQREKQLFSSEEYLELSQLFGQYTHDSQSHYDNSARAGYWRGEIYFITSNVKRHIIQHAIHKYSI